MGGILSQTAIRPKGSFFSTPGSGNSTVRHHASRTTTRSRMLCDSRANAEKFTYNVADSKDKTRYFRSRRARRRTLSRSGAWASGVPSEGDRRLRQVFELHVWRTF